VVPAGDRAAFDVALEVAFELALEVAFELALELAFDGGSGEVMAVWAAAALAAIFRAAGDVEMAGTTGAEG